MSEDGKDTMPSDSLDGRVVLRIIMTGREAGSIIGKGGEIVKKFRAETGANIQVRQIQQDRFETWFKTAVKSWFATPMHCKILN